MVLEQMFEPVDLIAQSMGGLIAIKAALAAPHQVRRIVLTGTSGGLPVDELGGADWRATYRSEFPNAAGWITEVQEDLSAQIPSIRAPTLLLWGDRDAVSPLSVGKQLRQLLPCATLGIVRGGEHDFAKTRAVEIKPLIASHLG